MPLVIRVQVARFVHMSSKTVTRAELYEQVWTTPMSRLAMEYGVSDVALAKTCKRMNIPRPGRGYWARLAAGAKPKRPPLPSRQQGQDETVTLRHIENLVVPPPRPKPPEVQIPQHLRRAHEAIQRLASVLAVAGKDEHGCLVVGGQTRPVLAVPIESHRRALLLLEGLSRAFVARGHAVALRQEGQHHALTVTANEAELGISLVEQLDKKPHELTPVEQQRVARGDHYRIPKYDYFPGGRLQIALHDAFTRGSWSDTKTRSLDRMLGSIVVAAEGEAEQRRLEQVAAEERRKQEEKQRLEREEAQRREREREALAKHRDALLKDLREMARKWTEAQSVHAFLGGVRAALPESERDETMVAWLGWAETQASLLDPLTERRRIAKSLEPSA